MILPIPGWCMHGASHRENCDAPSLPGNCPDTFVSRQILLKKLELRRNGICPDPRPLETPEVLND